MVPVAIDAEALQLLALDVDPVLGIGAAFGAELDRIDIVLVELLLAVLFLDLPLDGEAVAIPAGDVRRILAEQRLGANDHVLEDVVERVADVDVAIGIGRAIVEDELRRAGAGFTELAVKVFRLPPGEDGRLLLGEAGLHREVGLRQEDGASVVALLGFRLGHGRRP